MPRILILKPGKEYILLRKARKNFLCKECGKPILKGEYYIEDHINYLVPRRGAVPFKKWYVNRICVRSWRHHMIPLPESWQRLIKNNGQNF